MSWNADADAGSVIPSRNTRHYTLRSVPSFLGGSFLQTEDWDVLATATASSPDNTRLMCFNECVIVGLCFGYHSTEKAFRLDHKKGGVGTMETGSIHPPPSGSELSPHDNFIKARHWSAPPVIILKPFEGFWGHKYQLLEWYCRVGGAAAFWWTLSKAKVFQCPISSRAFRCLGTETVSLQEITRWVKWPHFYPKWIYQLLG